jgi:hypothetical protein
MMVFSRGSRRSFRITASSRGCRSLITVVRRSWLGLWPTVTPAPTGPTPTPTRASDSKRSLPGPSCKLVRIGEGRSRRPHGRCKGCSPRIVSGNHVGVESFLNCFPAYYSCRGSVLRTATISLRPLCSCTAFIHERQARRGAVFHG